MIYKISLIAKRKIYKRKKGREIMVNLCKRKYYTKLPTRSFDEEERMTLAISKAYWAGKAGRNLIRRVYDSIPDPYNFLINAINTRKERNKKASKIRALKHDLTKVGVIFKSSEGQLELRTWTRKESDTLDLTQFFRRKNLI
jgi:hypothetical protein